MLVVSFATVVVEDDAKGDTEDGSETVEVADEDSAALEDAVDVASVDGPGEEAVDESETTGAEVGEFVNDFSVESEGDIEDDLLEEATVVFDSNASVSVVSVAFSVSSNSRVVCSSSGSIVVPSVTSSSSSSMVVLSSEVVPASFASEVVTSLFVAVVVLSCFSAVSVPSIPLLCIGIISFHLEI